MVASGRRPGFYRAWSGRGNACEQVTGFPGAAHKRFAHYTAAARYWSAHSSAAVPSSFLPVRLSVPSSRVSPPASPASSFAVPSDSFLPPPVVEPAEFPESVDAEFSEQDGLSPPSYLVVRSTASRNGQQLQGIHFIPGDDPTWSQAITFLGAGGLEFAFLRDLHAARDFLGDPTAIPIVENSPLTPPPDSTAHRRLWPLFVPGTEPDPAPRTRPQPWQTRATPREVADTATRDRSRTRSARQRRLDSDDDSAPELVDDDDGDDADSATTQDGF